MDTLPITCRFADPWIADNSAFVVALSDIGSEVTSVKSILRERMAESILIAEPSSPLSISAVDAANIVVNVSDFSAVLVQAAIHYEGRTTFGPCMRFGPIDSETARLFNRGARIAAECELLASAENLVIADNSLWSFLMEANQTITAWSNTQERDHFASVIDSISSNFLPMLENKNLIAMPKSGTSCSISTHSDYKDLFKSRISDKYLLSYVLEPGEYTRPTRLSVLGSFGIEKRAKWDTSAIEKIYKEDLHYTYYRPWSYKSCYRIEGRKEILNDSILASVKEATKDRTIAEPMPQFLVDVAVKQLGGIAKLYGESNRHRIPFIGFNRTLGG